MAKTQRKSPRTSSGARKEIYPHFRRYLKAGHPALIVGEHSEDEYSYHKVTHSPVEGRRNNDMIFPNPNPSDKEPMYIARRRRHDKKKHFSKWKYPWKVPKK